MRLKHLLLIIIGAVLVWLLFVDRTILAPFILAAIFAYILNPVVNFLARKLHLNRMFGIIIVYSILIAIIVIIGTILVNQISQESIDITHTTSKIVLNAEKQTASLPPWLRPATHDFLNSFKQSRFLAFFRSWGIIPSFSQTLWHVVSFFIFLFSGYYFLKDGENFIDSLVFFVPTKYKIEVDLLLRKINSVLEGYLRGQMLLVLIMSVATFIPLTVLGVRFALSIAIFSGFAEIIPVIGPITAGTVAVLIVFLTGTSTFGLPTVNIALTVVLVYFILRQLEDYFIIPHVMAKITQLPPFLILFAVVSGGHLAGILGLILAVPTAAVIRLLVEFSMDRIHMGKG